MEIAVDSMDVVEFLGSGGSGDGGGGVVKVSITVIAAGVANGALRDREAVKKSVPLWNVPIIQEKVGGVDDHPPEKIVTCRKQIVGQVKNPVWDEEGGRYGLRLGLVMSLGRLLS